jgi:hypothetical protein
MSVFINIIKYFLKNSVIHINFTGLESLGKLQSAS